MKNKLIRLVPPVAVIFGILGVADFSPEMIGQLNDYLAALIAAGGAIVATIQKAFADN